MTIYTSQALAEANVTEGGGGGEPDAFVGVLDLVDLSGAMFAYGNRAMSAAMLGQPVYRLIREDDATEMDIVADLVTGEIDAAAVATWLGSSKGLLHIWYDQTGAENHLTSMGDQDVMMIWNAAVGDGKPGFARGSGFASNTHTYSPGATYACNFPDAGGQGTAFMLCRGSVLLNCRAATATHYFNMRGGPNAYIDTTTDGSDLNGAGGSYVGAGIVDSAWVLLDASVAFGENDYRYNGTRLTENNNNDIAAVPANPGLQPRLSWASAQTPGWGFQEVICCPGIIDADQRLAARQNMAAWAGITLA